MSFTQIKQLRQSGEFDKAYTMAKEELKAEPDNIWCKRALGWVLYDLVKKKISEADVSGAISYLREIQEIALPDDEKMIYDSLCWQIVKMLYSITDAQVASSVPQVDMIVRSFSISHPSEAYSALMKAMLRHSDKWTGYVSFYQWWDDCNFLPNDYKSEEYNGRKMKPLAELCFGAYAKQLFIGHYDASVIESFIVKLRGLIISHPDYSFLRYYLSKLLLKLGRKDEACLEILPFIRVKQREFWAWNYLAETLSDENDKLGCYCKAVLCGGKEEMMVSVHQSLAEIFAQKEDYQEANNELNVVLNIRQKMNWSIPDALLNMKCQGWFRENKPELHKNVYLGYAVKAEELLFNDVPEVEILVSYNNIEKQMISFITIDRKCGFISLKGRKELCGIISIGTAVSVRLAEIQEDKPTKYFSIRVLASPEKTATLINQYEGVVQINKEFSFGIVMSKGQKVFIPARMVGQSNIQDKSEVIGKMMPSYDKKRGQWGNTAITITKK